VAEVQLADACGGELGGELRGLLVREVPEAAGDALAQARRIGPTASIDGQ